MLSIRISALINHEWIASFVVPVIIPMAVVSVLVAGLGFFLLRKHKRKESFYDAGAIMEATGGSLFVGSVAIIVLSFLGIFPGGW